MSHEKDNKPCDMTSKSFIIPEIIDLAPCFSSLHSYLAAVTSAVMYTSLVLLIAISARAMSFSNEFIEMTELPEPLTESKIIYINSTLGVPEARTSLKNVSAISVKDATTARTKNTKRKNSTLNEAIQVASLQGLNAMIDLYERKEPEILRKGQSIKQHQVKTAHS